MWRGLLKECYPLVIEDFQVRQFILDALGEDDERPDGITLIVGSFREVTVGREQVIHLADKAARLPVPSEP